MWQRGKVRIGQARGDSVGTLNRRGFHLLGRLFGHFFWDLWLLWGWWWWWRDFGRYWSDMLQVAGREGIGRPAIDPAAKIGNE